MDASVVDLPEPVGPVTRMSPLCASVAAKIVPGILSSSASGISFSIFLKTAQLPSKDLYRLILYLCAPKTTEVSKSPVSLNIFN